MKRLPIVLLMLLLLVLLVRVPEATPDQTVSPEDRRFWNLTGRVIALEILQRHVLSFVAGRDGVEYAHDIVRAAHSEFVTAQERMEKNLPKSLEKDAHFRAIQNLMHRGTLDYLDAVQNFLGPMKKR